ncbi:MAG: hypothetical protein H2069_03530 [Legionella sp.]|nr:hypothetical protein [Legionella sp.]
MNEANFNFENLGQISTFQQMHLRKNVAERQIELYSVLQEQARKKDLIQERMLQKECYQAIQQNSQLPSLLSFEEIHDLGNSKLSASKKMSLFFKETPLSEIEQILRKPQNRIELAKLLVINRSNIADVLLRWRKSAEIVLPEEEKGLHLKKITDHLAANPDCINEIRQIGNRRYAKKHGLHSSLFAGECKKKFKKTKMTREGNKKSLHLIKAHFKGMSKDEVLQEIGPNKLAYLQKHPTFGSSSLYYFIETFERINHKQTPFPTQRTLTELPLQSIARDYLTTTESLSCEPPLVKKTNAGIQTETPFVFFQPNPCNESNASLPKTNNP